MRDLVHRPPKIQDTWNNGPAEDFPLTWARLGSGGSELKTEYYDGMAWTRWTSENWKIPVIAVCIYLVGLTVLLRVMKDRDPIEKKLINPLVALWNLGLRPQQA